MNSKLSPDNKIINGLWISPDGKPLSDLERLCIYSFTANGHDFHLWTYGDLPNIPADTAPGKVVVRDGNEILPKSKIFVSHNRLANFCDWFRWELMRKIGGWYADMDMICIRPISFAEDIVFCKEAEDFVNSAFMKWTRGHSFAVAMADACTNPGKITPWDARKLRIKKMLRPFVFWMSAHEIQGSGESGGPEGFTRAAKHFGIFQDALPFWQTMFITHKDAGSFFNDELHDSGVLQALLQNAHAVHIWHNGMRRRGIDPNGTFSPNSPYEILKRRYLPELQ